AVCAEAGIGYRVLGIGQDSADQYPLPGFPSPPGSPATPPVRVAGAVRGDGNTPYPNSPNENPKSKIQNREVLDALAQLREHSLILAEESSVAIRFRMLETLREFAGDQLTPEEREERERRHAVYFHQWVTGAQLFGSEQA